MKAYSIINTIIPEFGLILQDLSHIRDMLLNTSPRYGTCLEEREGNGGTGEAGFQKPFSILKKSLKVFFYIRNFFINEVLPFFRSPPVPLAIFSISNILSFKFFVSAVKARILYVLNCISLRSNLRFKYFLSTSFISTTYQPFFSVFCIIIKIFYKRIYYYPYY